MKTEPGNYSWEDLVKDKWTYWDGVRSYAGRNNMRAMRKGDLVFIYHSVKERNIVGIAKVIKEHYQDPTTTDNRWSVVDIEKVKPLKRRVHLSEIKAVKTLKDMELVRISRLSVQKLKEKEYDAIIKLSQKKAE